MISEEANRFQAAQKNVSALREALSVMDEGSAIYLKTERLLREAEAELWRSMP